MNRKGSLHPMLFALCSLPSGGTFLLELRLAVLRRKPGPVEPALVGTPLLDSKRPLKILRTVDCFDPCIACAVHVIAQENCTYTVRTG